MSQKWEEKVCLDDYGLTKEQVTKIFNQIQIF